MYLTLEKLIGACAAGALAGVLSLAAAPDAGAADNVHVGADFSRTTDRRDQASAIHPLALAIKGGVELTPHVAFEGSYRFGASTSLRFRPSARAGGPSR